jgi:hypothetical protein
MVFRATIGGSATVGRFAYLDQNAWEDHGWYQCLAVTPVGVLRASDALNEAEAAAY